MIISHLPVVTLTSSITSFRPTIPLATKKGTMQIMSEVQNTNVKTHILWKQFHEKFPIFSFYLRPSIKCLDLRELKWSPLIQRSLKKNTKVSYILETGSGKLCSSSCFGCHYKRQLKISELTRYSGNFTSCSNKQLRNGPLI